VGLLEVRGCLQAGGTRRGVGRLNFYPEPPLLSYNFHFGNNLLQ
jgi:hypothetical protein